MDLVSEVAGEPEKIELAPHALTLGITESAPVADAWSSVATLRDLLTVGVRLAIDDFGIGYSSLGCLHRFPVDTLEIDRSFVDGLGEESEDIAIVRAVIGPAHALRLEVIAEGVETADQIERLQAVGCELGQGCYFYKALPREEVEELLEEGRRILQRPNV